MVVMAWEGLELADAQLRVALTQRRRCRDRRRMLGLRGRGDGWLRRPRDAKEELEEAEEAPEQNSPPMSAELKPEPEPEPELARGAGLSAEEVEASWAEAFSRRQAERRAARVARLRTRGATRAGAAVATRERDTIRLDIPSLA
eukprot:COSAG01_NODE_1507_length_10090_cov_4.104694_4_plen_144_part_00